jgi:hypothetical protein
MGQPRRRSKKLGAAYPITKMFRLLAGFGWGTLKNGQNAALVRLMLSIAGPAPSSCFGIGSEPRGGSRSSARRSAPITRLGL